MSLPANTKVLTDRGKIKVAHIVELIEAGEELKAWTDLGWRKITGKFRYGIQPIFELLTKNSFKLASTEDTRIATCLNAPGLFLVKSIERQLPPGLMTAPFGIGTVAMSSLKPGDKIMLLPPPEDFLEPYESVTPGTLSLQLVRLLRSAEPLDNSSSLVPDVVSCVGYIGEGDTFDITVEEAYMFSANDVYVCNL